MLGIASAVKIMAIRAVPDRGDEKDSHIIKAFRYAAQNGAKVINCSFGKYEQSEKVSDVIREIGEKHGVLVVAIAHNQGGNIDEHQPSIYPALFTNSNLMVTTSHNSKGYLPQSANVGRESVDVSAPGVYISSLIPGNRVALKVGHRWRLQQFLLLQQSYF